VRGLFVRGAAAVFDFQPKVGLVYAVFVLVVDAAAGVVQTRLELVGVQRSG
jgi:hypothetical protein